MKLKQFFGSAKWEKDELVVRLPLSGFLNGYAYFREQLRVRDETYLPFVTADKITLKRWLLKNLDNTFRHVGECEQGQTHLHDWMDALIEMAMEDDEITSYSDVGPPVKPPGAETRNPGAE